MAENRGNPSGVTKGYVDPNTLKIINEVSSKYKDLIKSSFGTIKGFEDAIKKATENELKLMEKEAKNEEKWNKALNTVVNKFGMISDEFQVTLDESIKETKLIKKEYAESTEKARKDFIKQSFKNESSSKQIKYLDSKYSKGNNLANVSNEYYIQLEKLKSSSLDYDENFENDKQYRKALMNLNNDYGNQMIDAWKEDFKENHKVLGSVAEGIKDTFDKNKEVLQGFLGPLNLIIEPLKGFFGGFGLIFKGIKSGAKWLFGKFTKKNPTANDVMKSGAMGVGALYIGCKLDDLLGGTVGKNSSTILDKLKELSNIISTLNGAVKSLGTVASVAGLTMIVKDAISGWNKADEWGVENWAGMLGAIIGGTGSGSSGAIHGAIKYALLGAPFGIAGILVGGIMGGILGFFGGEFWSQGIQDIKDLLTGKTNMTSLRKKSLLEDLEKRKEKGEIDENQLSLMYRLADKLSDEDFASMGTNMSNKNWGGGVEGTIKQWLGGNFDSLNDDEIASVLTTMLGSGFNITKDNLSTYKELFTNLHKSFNEVGLSNIYKNSETLGWNLRELQAISGVLNAKKRGEIDYDEFSKSLEKLGFIGGVTSESFNNLLKSGLLSIDLEKLDVYTRDIKKKNQSNEFLSNINYVEDAIIRTDGSIIKTNPKDTLVALKDIPLSLNQVREDTNRNLNSSLGSIENNGNLDKNMTTIIDVLSKILEKNIQVQLPPQTRSDLDILMSGGMI